MQGLRGKNIDKRGRVFSRFIPKVDRYRRLSQETPDFYKEGLIELFCKPIGLWAVCRAYFNVDA